MYSSLGSYGGFGSLGSGYGSSSFGSSYGSSFGSNYGSLGSQPAQGQQQSNLRGQYYGMLGGLNSILQLGFAGISLTVFVKNVASIIKTSFNWFKTIITRFSKFLINLPLIRLIPLIFAKLNVQYLLKPSPDSAHKNKLMYYLRILAIIGLVIMIYVKSQMKKQIDKEFDDMVKDGQDQEHSINHDKKQGLIQMNGEYYQKEGFF